MGRKKRPGANTAGAEAGSWWPVQDPSVCWGRRGQTANTGRVHARGAGGER